MLENLFLKFCQGLLNKDINLKILVLTVQCGFVISGDGWLVVMSVFILGSCGLKYNWSCSLHIIRFSFIIMLFHKV